ncbi:MAG TPA: hypothetical protein VML54_02140 [Candidatus Limnocylindrales bacterium]|nr:hypothetical protein [Candidatus Limnocylindrales bacterium]
MHRIVLRTLLGVTLTLVVLALAGPALAQTFTMDDSQGNEYTLTVHGNTGALLSGAGVARLATGNSLCGSFGFNGVSQAPVQWVGAFLESPQPGLITITGVSIGMTVHCGVRSTATSFLVHAELIFGGSFTGSFIRSDGSGRGPLTFTLR